ncbi:MAG: zinc-binding dehydrogenase [Spirochaetia bacterium]|nr:zinc-binding dehydrogenase [Spirochaetia bacterium]
MKAAVLYSGDRQVRIEDVPRPTPGPGEVRVRVRACGVCGSDVHLVRHGTLPAKSYPVIPGHESAGEVQENGPGASLFQKGDRVVVNAGTCCGTCPMCQKGRDNFCDQVGVLGFDRNGAFAEEIVIPERYLTLLPASIPFERGAILADAVSTPYHALRYMGMMEPGEQVAVFGCGGLGIHAVLLAKALGAGKVYALDVHEGALENARKAGADVLVPMAGVKSAGKRLKEISGGVDLVLDFSGYYRGVETMFRALNTGGRLVLVGIGRGGIELAIAPLMIYKQLSMRGSYGSDRRAVPELIQLVADGRLDLSGSISGVHKLEELNDCLSNLDTRHGNPIRYIIEP